MFGRPRASLILATLAIGAGVAFAGETNEERPELYFVYKEIVKPANASQYEAATKHFISELNSYQIDPEKVNFRTVTGPELGYVYVMPLKDFADIDTMHERWDEAIGQIGESRWKEIAADMDEHVESRETSVARWREDLSYYPETPDLPMGEVKFLSYEFYYAIPGKEKELEDVAKDFIKLYEKKGINYGWSVYKVSVGTDLPMYLVAKPGKDRLDAEKRKQEAREQCGEDGRKLNERAARLCRKIETKDGWLRPDLSFPSTEKAK